MWNFIKKTTKNLIGWLQLILLWVAVAFIAMMTAMMTLGWIPVTLISLLRWFGFMLTKHLVWTLVALLVIVVSRGLWVFFGHGNTAQLKLSEELKVLIPIGTGLFLAINALYLYEIQSNENKNDKGTFQAAIQNLDHDSESVRLGGIYALYGLAGKPRYKKDVHEILCAYIRSKTNANDYKEKGKETLRNVPSTEIQALLDLLTIEPKNHAFVAGGRPLKVNLRGAHLQGAQLQDADLRRAQLQGANLHNARLQGANLHNARLQGANLHNARLRGTNLYDAQLQGANLHNARLQGADLSRAQLQGANLHNARLQDADLWDAQLQGANLRDAQLQGADLRNAQLQGVVLRDAQLQGARLWDAQLQGADLRNAQLQGVDLSDAQLQGVNLHNAWLQGADLSRAQLQGANLHNAWLQGADLHDAQLQGANLHNARLHGADLHDAQLQDANLQDAQLQGSYSTKILRYSTMTFADQIEERVSGKTNLDTVVFADGMSLEQLEEMARNMDLNAVHWVKNPATKNYLELLLQKLKKEHVGKRKITGADKEKSSQYLKNAKTGSYTAEEAEQWIAEYIQATGSYK